MSSSLALLKAFFFTRAVSSLITKAGLVITLY
jgi:hypothetical protein